jgi:hypothetical protein
MCAEGKGHACGQRNSGKQGETRQEGGSKRVKNGGRRRMDKRRPSSASWALMIPSKMTRRHPPLARAAATSFTIPTNGGQNSKWRIKIELIGHYKVAIVLLI